LKIDVSDWLRMTYSADVSDRVAAADEPPFEPALTIRARLVELLADEVPLVRTCASDSLWAFKDKSVSDALMQALSKESDAIAQRHMAGALGSVADIEGFGEIIELLEDLPHAAKLSLIVGLHISLSRVLASTLSHCLTADEELASVAVDGALEVVRDLQMRGLNLVPELEARRDTSLRPLRDGINEILNTLERISQST
jgi:HEAT repeat protein